MPLHTHPSGLESAVQVFQFRGEFDEGHYDNLTGILDDAVETYKSGDGESFHPSKYSPLSLSGRFTFLDERQHKIEEAEIEVSEAQFELNIILDAIRQKTKTLQDRIHSPFRVNSQRDRILTVDRTKSGFEHFDESWSWDDYRFDLVGPLVLPKDVAGIRVSEALSLPKAFEAVQIRDLHDHPSQVGGFCATIIDRVEI